MGGEEEESKLNAKDKGLDLAAQELTKIVVLLYILVLFLSGLSWLIYYKCFRKTVSTVQGKVWSKKEIEQELSYYDIVPGSARRYPPPRNNYSQPEYLMPGLISTYESESNCGLPGGQELSSLDRPPSYNSSINPRIVNRF